MHKFDAITQRLTDNQAAEIEERFEALTDSDGNNEWIKPGCQEELFTITRTAHLVLEFKNGPVGFWRVEAMRDHTYEPWFYIDLSSGDKEPFLGYEFGEEEWNNHMLLAAEELKVLV